MESIAGQDENMATNEFSNHLSRLQIFLKKLIPIALLSLVITGCTTVQSYKLYSGPQRPSSEVSFLESTRFRIIKLHNLTTGYSTSNPAGNSREFMLELDPGVYEMRLFFRDSNHEGFLTRKAELKKGRRYIIEGETKYHIGGSSSLDFNIIDITDERSNRNKH